MSHISEWIPTRLAEAIEEDVLFNGEELAIADLEDLYQEVVKNGPLKIGHVVMAIQMLYSYLDHAYQKEYPFRLTYDPYAGTVIKCDHPTIALVLMQALLQHDEIKAGVGDAKEYIDHMKGMLERYKDWYDTRPAEQKYLKKFKFSYGDSSATVKIAYGFGGEHYNLNFF
jgi:hypothetical protein